MSALLKLYRAAAVGEAEQFLQICRVNVARVGWRAAVVQRLRGQFAKANLEAVFIHPCGLQIGR